MSPTYSMQDLLALMQQLREPETGCPWDKKQTLHGLTAYTIDEAYEVVDSIEQNDLAGLQSELGDLLFQVVFYSQIAEEQGLFNFQDVVRCRIQTCPSSAEGFQQVLHECYRSFHALSRQSA